jgi:glutathione S-transferase
MSELTLVIGNKNYSSWSMRPWLLMRQLGIEFDEVQIPLRQRDCRGRYGAAGEFLFGEFTVADAMFAPVASLSDLRRRARRRCGGVRPSDPRGARSRGLDRGCAKRAVGDR